MDFNLQKNDNFNGASIGPFYNRPIKNKHIIIQKTEPAAEIHTVQAHTNIHDNFTFSS